MTADARFALYVARSLTRQCARQHGEGGNIDSEATDPHWVVPPIRMAGWAFRRLAMLVRQLFVPVICVYPGKAKYSIDTLTRDGSTAAAPEGGVDGTATARTWDSHTSAARMAENRVMIGLPPRGGAGMVDDEGGVPEAIRRECGFIALLGASPDIRDTSCEKSQCIRGPTGKAPPYRGRRQ